MGNAAGVRHYFIEAFTPYGYISLLSKLLKDIEHTYFLTGGPGTGKSTMIKLIGIQLIDRGYDVDYVRSIREPDSVAGLVLPKHKLCLLDKNEFVDQSTLGEYHREIDFTALCRRSRIEQHRQRMTELETDLKSIEQSFINQLQEDYEVNPEHLPEAVKKEEVIDIESILAVKEGAPHIDEITEILSKIKKNSLRFLFLHGLQMDGWLNLAPRYIRDFDRICLEGEDSSKLLKEIVQEVKCLGQMIEIIVHPLKPFTIVGIVFPEKNLAVWKGNPCRIEEQGFCRQHSPEMSKILEYNKKARVELKSLINDAVNFRGLDDLRSELVSSILADLRKA